MMKGYGQYSKAYQSAAVSTVDQRKLIVMMYEGAIKFLTISVDKIGKGEFYDAHTNLVRAKSIIAELLASLNLEKGGDIAENLQRLYTYMFNELIEANLNKDTARIENVTGLLRELRDGWRGMERRSEPKNAPAEPNPRSKRINLQG